MKTFFIVLGIIVIVLAILLVVLYFLGKNLQKKQASQQEAMDAADESLYHRYEDDEGDGCKSSEDGNGADTKVYEKSKTADCKGKGRPEGYVSDL